MKRMMLMVFLLSPAFVQAGLIYREYSASPRKAETALSNDTGTQTVQLYINTNGFVSSSNPAGNDVFLKAVRYRQRKSIVSANNIEEYVELDGSATDGIHLSYLSAGTTINSSLGYEGGNLLYRFDAWGQGNTYKSAGPGYLGFRIYAGSAGSYFYGWARVSGFIKTENATYDLNQASVTVTEVGIMDVPNVFIEAGQTYIPTAGMQMLGTNGVVIASMNTVSLTDGSEFHPIGLGSECSHAFSISNNGTGILTLNDYVLSDTANFIVTELPVSVAVGAVSNFTVTYSPAGMGSHLSTLVISNDTPATNYTLNLAGACYTISTNNGPYAGGNSVTISNEYFGLITNVLVEEESIVPTASGDNWFTLVMPGISSAGPADITVQIEDDEIRLPDAYTYNSSGRIFERVPDWGAWEQVESMPVYMRQGGAAVLNDSIYVVAGSVSGSMNTNVYCFDGVNWTQVKGLPGNRKLENHAVAEYDGKIYACGGYMATGSVGNMSTEVWMFDGTNWSQGPDLPEVSYKGAAAVYSNRLIVTEGYYGSDVYSFDGAAWTTITPMPKLLVYPGAAVLDGHLYIIGGTDSSMPPGVTQTNVYRYDGSSWISAASLSNAMNTPAAATMDSSIYVLGQTNNSFYPTLCRFDGVSWTNAPGNLPVLRQEQSLLLFSNYLYMVGGNGYPPTDTEVYRYQPSTLDVSGVSPPSGSITGGYEVVIVGTNLCSIDGDVTNVTLRDVDVIQIMSASPTQIVVVAGFGTAADIGVGDARVFSVSIGETCELAAFEYIPEQWITNFMPTNGSAFLASDSVELSAQAFSELPVGFSVVSGPGSITDNTNLSFLSSGIVVIAASQLGDSTWPPAPTVTNSYTSYPLPVVGPVTVWRATNNANLKIPDVQLLSNSVCPAGTRLSVVWVSAASSNGGTVAVDGRWTTYEPPPGDDSPDYFQFLVRNGYGGETQGTAEVLVFVPRPEETMNVDTVVPTASNTVVRFVGIPGRRFEVQITTNLVSGTWQNAGAVTMNELGYVIFTNNGTPPSSQYFRTVEPIE